MIFDIAVIVVIWSFQGKLHWYLRQIISSYQVSWEIKIMRISKNCSTIIKLVKALFPGDKVCKHWVKYAKKFILISMKTYKKFDCKDKNQQNLLLCYYFLFFISHGRLKTCDPSRIHLFPTEKRTKHILIWTKYVFE